LFLGIIESNFPNNRINQSKYTKCVEKSFELPAKFQADLENEQNAEFIPRLIVRRV